MNIKKMVGAVMGAAMLAILGVVATVQPAAAAEWSPQSEILCSATSQCGISVPVYDPNGERTQGKPFSVNVIGQKGKAVSIRAYAVKWTGSGENDYQWVPISGSVSATPTGSSGATYGQTRVQLTVTTPPAGVDGSMVYVQTTDFKKGHALVGSALYSNPDIENSGPAEFEVLTARGYDKGFAEKEFVNGIFHRNVSVAIPGDRYSVQMLRGGKWVTIDNPRATPAVASKSGLATIQGLIPADLPTGKYRTRIVNVTRGITDLTSDENWAYFTWSRTPKPGDKDFDVYTQPGTWEHNGRFWRTSCEKYSITERCTTLIHATQVIAKDGKFYSSTDYHFNNLTYKPSARSNWTNNPLGGFGKTGYKGSWTADDGRKWRVECDTSVSGRNGCRAYNTSRVAEAYTTSSGATSYRVVTKEIFNNIVKFK